MNLGFSEILVILLVVLLLFGGRRLPELAKSVGRGLAEFRRATQDVQRDLNSSLELPPRPSSATPGVVDDRNPIIANAPPAAQPRTSEAESQPDSTGS